jgi:hypothetical protein
MSVNAPRRSERKVYDYKCTEWNNPQSNCPQVCPMFSFNCLTEKLYCSGCFLTDIKAEGLDSAQIEMTLPEYKRWKDEGKLPATALRVYQPEFYASWRTWEDVPTSVILPQGLRWLYGSSSNTSYEELRAYRATLDRLTPGWDKQDS